MPDGYIKLWRKSMDSEVFADPALWQLWCYILMMVSWRSRFFPVRTGRGRGQVALRPGQCVFALRTWAAKLGCSRSSLDRRLKRLITMKMVGHKPGRHYSILTVVNWDSYQSGEDENGTPNGPPNGTPTGTPTGHQRDKRKKEEEGKELSAGAGAASHYVDDLEQPQAEEAPPTPAAEDEGKEEKTVIDMSWLRLYCMVGDGEAETFKRILRTIDHEWIRDAIFQCRRERRAKGLPKKVCLSDLVDALERINREEGES
jgi:hypothetical protein